MGSYMDRAGHVTRSSRDCSVALVIAWLRFLDRSGLPFVRGGDAGGWRDFSTSADSTSTRRVIQLTLFHIGRNNTVQFHCVLRINKTCNTVVFSSHRAKIQLTSVRTR
jgi:hypothetical protein